MVDPDNCTRVVGLALTMLFELQLPTHSFSPDQASRFNHIAAPRKVGAQKVRLPHDDYWLLLMIC